MPGRWDEALTYRKGVGEVRATLLAQELHLRTWDDLLHHYPRAYLDRSQVLPLSALAEQLPSHPVTVIGRIGRPELKQVGKRRVATSSFTDGSGQATLVWFQQARGIVTAWQEGGLVALTGKPTRFRNTLQFTHPELTRLEDEDGRPAPIVPVYPSTDRLKKAGLDTRGLRRLIHQLVLDEGSSIPEFLPPELLRELNLLRRSEALTALHIPPDAVTLARAQFRLKLEELLLFQLVLAQRRQRSQAAHRAIAFQQVGELLNTFYREHLPFALTGAQKRVVKEVRADLGRPVQMNRLVQGDVGSGKTMVALLCMLIALDNGCQAAMMAPTELLAEQHWRNLNRYLAPLGLEAALLTGSLKPASRREVLYGIASGHTRLVVGTHALLEDPVQFQRLGLTIIDEQHKFGVLQRARLWGKAPTGLFPHNLLMTATPIPRTLAMTAYGEVDVSIIDELPPGRTPIKTYLRNESQRLRLNGFVREQLELGRQAYFVYPLIEESEKTDLLALDQGYENSVRAFDGYRVGVVHGRMAAADKEAEMARFLRRETQILVSTTVIEVGVDVPNATVMVIEHAERFGLSQLHQLRGRVGRGGAQSYCILMTPETIGRDSRTRLQALVESTDGFRIAEIDLALRGPGDFLGTRQSGLPEFALADLNTDGPLVATARDLARRLIAQDPNLANPEHAALRQHLNRFRTKHQLDLLTA